MPRAGSPRATAGTPLAHRPGRRRPLRPARPDQPELLAPQDVPRRRPGSPTGRIALLHAVAHIELNAVDLHWDIIARFTDQPMPLGFYDDWVKAADEEAKHFNLICDCLEAMGSHYGALPAHAGMWRAAEDTADDLLGRLAVVPMVLEARGLDVTPGMIEIFRKAGEAQAARRAGGDLCRRGRACRLWLEMVQLAVRARRQRPEGGVSRPGPPLFPRRAEAALQRGKARRSRHCRRISTGRWPKDRPRSR